MAKKNKVVVTDTSVETVASETVVAPTLDKSMRAKELFALYSAQQDVIAQAEASIEAAKAEQSRVVGLMIEQCSVNSKLKFTVAGKQYMGIARKNKTDGTVLNFLRQPATDEEVLSLN